MYCLIGQLGMHGAGVGIRVNGDRSNSKAASGFDDTARDLATVGNQNLVEKEIIDIRACSARKGRLACRGSMRSHRG
jgi:hypothetical protein